MDIIELNGVSINYGDTAVLRDVNLRVKEGEVLGVIGPTGSGKTTLIRVIDLLVEPSAGEITFMGSRIKSRVDVRRRIGVVFQNTPVFRGTVHDNVVYGPSLRGRRPDRTEVAGVLEMVGLDGYGERRASELSGGERQRLALAQALINEPDVLLLDEATANLDPLSREKIEGVIDDLRGEVAVVFTTHNLLQGQMMADRIAILNRTIMHEGRPSEIFRKPANSFVAEFVGAKNVLKGFSSVNGDGVSVIECKGIQVYSSTPAHGKVTATIRPEDITVSFKPRDSSALNQLMGTVTGVRETGPLYSLQIACGGEVLTVYMTRKSFKDMAIKIGGEVWIEFKASAVHIINES